MAFKIPISATFIFCILQSSALRRLRSGRKCNKPCYRRVSVNFFLNRSTFSEVMPKNKVAWFFGSQCNAYA